MSGLLSYSGVTTKIRAMSKNFITENGFREIVSLPNVPAVVTYLKKDPAYTNVLASLDENSLHRGTIEFLIGNSIYYDFQNIYNCAQRSGRNLRVIVGHDTASRFRNPDLCCTGIRNTLCNMDMNRFQRCTFIAPEENHITEQPEQTRHFRSPPHARSGSEDVPLI